MPAKSYTFTQHFGCVPQLGNLYFPGEGCPATAPVIHTGIDLAAPEGTPFYAAASGWVTLADYDRPTADANTRIIIQHDGRNEGYATDYLHWVASYVEEGDYVHAGDPIGEVGNVGFSTGPHLHFSVTDLDTGEFIDPLRWLPDEPGLEGYVSRMPTARLRLPAGTTAGQPESADPAPPPPAVKENVPESPSRRRQARRANQTSVSGRSVTRRHATIPRRTMPSDQTRSHPVTTRHRRRMRTESTSDAKHDRDRSRERERSPERNKDGSPSEDAASGDDGASRDKRADSSKERPEGKPRSRQGRGRWRQGGTHARMRVADEPPATRSHAIRTGRDESRAGATSAAPTARSPIKANPMAEATTAIVSAIESLDLRSSV